MSERHEQAAAKVCPECGKPPLHIHGHQIDACFGGLINGCISACCGHGGRKPAYLRLNTSNGYIDICGGEVISYHEYRLRQEQDAA